MLRFSEIVDSRTKFDLIVSSFANIELKKSEVIQPTLFKTNIRSIYPSLFLNKINSTYPLTSKGD